VNADTDTKRVRESDMDMKMTLSMSMSVGMQLGSLTNRCIFKIQHRNSGKELED